MCVDLDRWAVGVSAGWPNGNMAQQTQTVTSTTSSLVQPRTGCVLHTQHTHRYNIIKIVRHARQTQTRSLQIKKVFINADYN